MNTETSIFNERGVLRSDLENVVVPAERRPVLNALIAATMAADEAERQLKIKDEAVAAAVKAHDRAVAACPQSSFLDEWRTATKQYREERHPSLRETWPPETVAMEVDEGASADVGEGDFSASPAMPLVPPLEALRLAVAALDAARHDLRVARDALTSARANVAKALAAYNQAVPVISAEQNTRDWIASNNAERARRAAERGYLPPTLTQTARAMGGGGHGPSNEIRTRRGGGPAYRRGPDGQPAYSKAQAAQITAQRIRDARTKLPSER